MRFTRIVYMLSLIFIIQHFCSFTFADINSQTKIADMQEKQNVAPNPDVHPEYYNKGIPDNGSLKMTSKLVSSVPLWEKQTNASMVNPPNKGRTERILILPIEFSDVKFNRVELDGRVTILMNQLKDYLERNSGYVPNIKGTTIEYTMAPIITTGAAMSYYGADSGASYVDDLNGNIFELAREAVQLSDASVNFNDYDTNNDGITDHIIVMHAGDGQETSYDANTIWSHSWNIYNSSAPAGEAVDGVRVFNYICVSGTGSLGVLAHEFAHDLGLPDLYDTNGFIGGNSDGAGSWDLMASGSWNHLTGQPAGSSPSNLSAWSRVFLGWDVPITINTNSSITVTNNNGLSQIYKLQKSNTTSTIEEYYLIEFRKRLGSYDIALPGEGLLIWHIDQQRIDELWRQNTFNSYNTRLGVSLEQADGLKEMDSNTNASDAGDPFPGFTTNRNFAASPYGLNYSNISPSTFNFVDVLNIQMFDTTASAVAYVEPAAPTVCPSILFPEDLLNTTARPSFQWMPLPLAQHYKLQISESRDFSSYTTTYTLKRATDGLNYNGSSYSFTLPDSFVFEGGMTYYWRLAGTNELTASGSEVWSSVRKVQVPNPIGSPSVTFSFDGENPGRLMGITTGMEVSFNKGASYIKVTENNLQLAPHVIALIHYTNDIRIRLAATQTAPEGSIQLINILQGNAPDSIAADDNQNRVIGMDNSLEFSTNQVSWTKYNSTTNNLPDLSANITLYIRYFATGLVQAGPVKTLVFTASEIIVPIGGGGGGSTDTGVTPAPVLLPVQVPPKSIEIPHFGTEDLGTQIDDKKIKSVIADISTTTAHSIVLTSQVLKDIISSGKSLTIKGENITIILPWSLLSNSIAPSYGMKAELQIDFILLSEEELSKRTGGSSPSGMENLLLVGGASYEFHAKWQEGTNAIVVSNFNTPATVGISLEEINLSSEDSDKLGVYYYNEITKGWEYMGGTYNPATRSIVFTTNHFSLYSVMKYDITFSDITKHWAKKDIEVMAARHITTGVSGNRFNPKGEVTRAEFISWLVRALNQDNTEGTSNVELPFNDIKTNKWYSDEISAAYRAGIILEEDGVSFRPDAKITREEMAVMIARALRIRKGLAVYSKEKVQQKLVSFKDFSQIPEASREAIALVVDNSIIKGRNGNLFAPKANATRAEGMVMIRRLLAKI